jgi:hypothetical protein
MTISEAREMCVKARDAGQKVFGDLTAAEEAQYEPFRKILSGDKLNLYNDRLKKYKLYGAGGKVLVSLRHEPPPGMVDHFAIGVERFDKDSVTRDLKGLGLTPHENLEFGFYVDDPDGVHVQITGI